MWWRKGNRILGDGNFRFLRKSQNPKFIYSTGNTAMNKSEEKSLHSRYLHSSGHNVRQYDLGEKYLLIGMVS